jgi:tRNA (guanine37-N1)-methyltransferase
MTWQLAFITIYPEVINQYKKFGIFKAAEDGGQCEILVVDLRDFAADKHASVDAQPYGGGDGMVLRPDCLLNALKHVEAKFGKKTKVIYTSPSGRPWKQVDAEVSVREKMPLVFICGRFAGIDQRFIDQYVTVEYSLGDFILAGGELPSLAMAESCLRLCSGVLGNADSARNDSFSESFGGLLEYPSYTRPPVWDGLEVPKVLLSGNHQEIERWRRLESLKKTEKIRPDLISKNKV